MRRSEVLRYLGYGGQDVTPELSDRVAQMMERCQDVARPAVVRREFAVLSARDDQVELEGCSLRLVGHDITARLCDAVSVVLVAATLGVGVDRELRRLSLTDALGELVFDAAATVLVEQVMDETEASVRLEARERGLYCSSRFSPGYGDLPLEVQPAFLASLDAARRLGISLTASNLMVPTKSVTAVIGLHQTPRHGTPSSCETCNLADVCARRVGTPSCSPSGGIESRRE